MLNAVIFDLDGTLVDSEVIWLEVTRELVESFGKEFNDTFHEQIRGTGSKVSMIKTKEFFDLPVSVEELIEIKDRMFHTKISQTLPKKNPGVDMLLQTLTEAGIPFGLATSGSRPMVEFVMKGHGWFDQFGAIVTLEDVVATKPAPDLYEEAARRLGQMPATCVAFEDAPVGVQSAKAAGMKVVGISSPATRDGLAEADHQVQSFEEISLDDLRALLSTDE